MRLLHVDTVRLLARPRFYLVGLAVCLVTVLSGWDPLPWWR